MTFDPHQEKLSRGEATELIRQKTMPPWHKDFVEDRSFDPTYRPSMTTFDYHSSERRSVDQRAAAGFQRENEALRSAARTVDSPFTDEILNAPSPRKFFMPIPHEDPLVVSLTVAKCLVRRVLIDPGSSANIMPRDTFDRLEIKQDQLKSTGNPLVGFDGKGWIHRVRGVPSTLHQVMRCLAPDGTKVIDIHGDQVAAKECYSVTLKHAGKGKAPIRSKQRRFAPERNRIIAEEVDRLLDVGFVREVHYPDWLSNVVIVQKKNGKWRNAGATYQRLISKIFKEQIGKTVEDYIDDMVVKSKKKADHVQHLRGVFDILRRYGMKLNPTKCSFGVSSGQFLGHMVNLKGIEASPAQANALTKNAEPKTIKEVQTLTGWITALSRFISELSDRCKPFFDTIRSHGRQVWGDEQRLVLTALKKYMQNLPVLSAPKSGEKLFLYLGVSSIATSGVLIRYVEGKQYPVFYVSKTMTEAEGRYSKAERVILLLVHAKRKLRIILHKPDLSGRMTKWAIELSSFDITYDPRTAVKGQAVADFLLECDSEDVEEDLCIGIKLQTPEGTALSQALRLEFAATNNEAEYETLLAGIKLAKELKVRNLNVFSDSQLVVRQVRGEYKTKDETMEAYRSAVMREAQNFEKIEFIQIPRECNGDADRLACSASGSGETLAKVVPVGILNQPSIFEEPSGSDPWGEIISTQSNGSRVLLAKHVARFGRIVQKVR
ncbi:uncharacterized protein LOC132279586 [Cornus florida]|uniref:uncharacterized protein LOC132279586 n=1 Tax=Cornus florida TaxID=4283 RepID=UPI0028983634|nr:uncharacterized protein LOC132279586 [Cornus florida]